MSLADRMLALFNYSIVGTDGHYGDNDDDHDNETDENDDDQWHDDDK
jgi:hypothetical protein